MKNRSVFVRILFLMCSVVFLTGFAYYKVDLNYIDDNHRLVNLGSIINSGGKYLPNDNKSSEDSTVEDVSEASLEKADPTNQKETTQVNTSQEEPQKKEDINVTIIGTMFFFDENKVGRDIETVEVYVGSWKKQGIHVSFDLELADYKTVIKLWKLLEEKEFTDYEPKE